MEPQNVFRLESATVDGENLLVPPEFVCPLSLQLMHDPVIIASGQTYERSAIQRWFDEGHKTCPSSNKSLGHTRLFPNQAVRQLISDWCHANGVPFERGVYVFKDQGFQASGLESYSAAHMDQVIKFRLQASPTAEGMKASALSTSPAASASAAATVAAAAAANRRRPGVPPAISTDSPINWMDDSDVSSTLSSTRGSSSNYATSDSPQLLDTKKLLDTPGCSVDPTAREPLDSSRAPGRGFEQGQGRVVPSGEVNPNRGTAAAFPRTTSMDMSRRGPGVEANARAEGGRAASPAFPRTISMEKGKGPESGSRVSELSRSSSPAFPRTNSMDVAKKQPVAVRRPRTPPPHPSRFSDREKSAPP